MKNEGRELKIEDGGVRATPQPSSILHPPSSLEKI
jgi:hypothetical protein